MEAIACIKGRRSIRNFTNKPIDHSLLKDIIEVASYAPSWKHTQIVRYIAIEGSLKDKIATDCTSNYPSNGTIIANAPMLVAITVLKNRSGYERDGSFSTPRNDSWQMFDAGIAAETFCLAAYEKGIGSVILGIFEEAKVASLLEIEEDKELVALIPIGYQAEEPVAPRRKSINDLLTIKE